MRTSLPAVAIERPVCAVNRPSLRVATFEDYDGIAALESSVGLGYRARGSWLDLWRRNPAYLPDWPIGWVLEDREKHIVGTIANIPSLYRLEGNTHLVGTLRGWGVDPKYRAFSLMLVMHDLQHSRVDLQLVTTAGRMSEPVLKRLGWSRLEVGQWDRTALWVTNYSGSVRSYLQSKLQHTALRFLAAGSSAPLTLVDLMQRCAREPRSPYKLEWSETFDDRFDRFWDQLQKRQPNRFLGLRTKEALQWRFNGSLDPNPLWILTASDASGIAAYAVLQRADVTAMDAPRVVLSDLQALDDSHELSSAMLNFALARCRREGIYLLENPGCWLEVMQPGLRPRPHHRDLANWTSFIKPGNTELARKLKGAWRPTMYDGDALL